MTHIRSRPVALALLVAAAAARADVGPAGGEFLVNTYTTAYQGDARVALDPSGGFVVVWQSGYSYSSSQDGSGSCVAARRFGPTGVPLGNDFVVNTFTPSTQRQPDVASDPSGNFVVTWESGTPSYSSYGSHPDGSAAGVFLQRFNAGGVRLGSEVRVNTFTPGRQGSPRVARDTAGNFVVVWESGGYRFTQDGSTVGIFGQRFDANGSPLGPEFQVNTYTTGPQRAPAVTMDPLGNFVVVWQSGYYGLTPDGSGPGIFGRRFDSAGTPLGAEFQVNTYTTGRQTYPAVASDGIGDFVVVWESGYYTIAQDGSGIGVFGQRFDSAGFPVGAEFQVNTYTSGDQSMPAVAADQSGNFIVTWRGSGTYPGQDGSASGIFGQHFTAAGLPNGPEFQVNTFTTNTQFVPSVGATPSGDFVVTWQSTGYPGQDGSGSGVFGQRLRTTAFTPPAVVAGTKISLRDGPLDARRKALSVRSEDAAITLGAGPGSIDDPTLTGGRLRVRGTAFDDTYQLPAAHWRATTSGAGTTYSYHDGSLLDGPVKDVRVRRGRFKAVAKGAQLGHSLAANPDPVTTILQIGDRGQRYCTQFGGTVYYKPDVVYRGRAAPAPAVCPR
jgi:hypothetical protein